MMAAHKTTIIETSRTSFARRTYEATCICGWMKTDTSRGDIAFDATCHRKRPDLARAGESIAAKILTPHAAAP